MRSPRCRLCGRFLGNNARRRRYCSHACKQAAYRARKRNRACMRPPEILGEWESQGLAPEIRDRLRAIYLDFGPRAALACVDLLQR